jgi:protocatechuate 3,4-dioxygenase beta subunit
MKETMVLTRRDALLKCAALGSLAVAAPTLGSTQAVSAWMAQEQSGAKKPTPWNEIGPFYKKLAPNAAQLRAPNDPGLPLAVGGQVFGTRGNALAGATIEIWQANHHGLYDLDGYRYRAALKADVAGTYAFDSIMPGHYPARVCQHIHYIVTAPGHKPLITQLYFATDPVFDGDPDRNYMRDPLVLSRDLVRPVTLTGDPKAIQAKVRFDLVLERL